MGREAKVINKLTKKQALFIKELANGRSATQAALIAYNTNDPNSAKVIASQNLTKLNIVEALKEAFELNGLSLTSILGNIKELATHKSEKISADVVLRSNVELLKLSGAYPGKHSTQVSVDYHAKIDKLSNKELKVEIERVERRGSELISQLESN